MLENAVYLRHGLIEAGFEVSNDAIVPLTTVKSREEIEAAASDSFAIRRKAIVAPVVGSDWVKPCWRVMTGAVAS